MMAGVRPLTTIIQYAKNLQNMANDGPKKKKSQLWAKWARVARF
jgi:hypothetical protein